MIKAVIQEEKTGCGIASVATLVGISYQQAKKTANSLGIYADDKALWSDTAYVRKLLTHYGISTSTSEHLFSGWEALPDRALLAIKWHKENGVSFWHWVVFVREGEHAYVLDPKKGLASNVRTDFGRIRPKWFIEILANSNNQ